MVHTVGVCVHVTNPIFNVHAHSTRGEEEDSHISSCSPPRGTCSRACFLPGAIRECVRFTPPRLRSSSGCKVRGGFFLYLDATQCIMTHRSLTHHRPIAPLPAWTWALGQVSGDLWNQVLNPTTLNEAPISRRLGLMGTLKDLLGSMGYRILVRKCRSVSLISYAKLWQGIGLEISNLLHCVTPNDYILPSVLR